MTDHDGATHTGNTLFEAFVEQVKQVLEHLYDFAYLQQHPLARFYDREDDLSARMAGRQLRQELITAIEGLKPNANAYFRTPVARLYNILHLYYVENLTMQETAIELGLSERQAYRDLRRGQESIAAVLWDRRLPAETQQPEKEAETEDADFSFASEIARWKLNFSLVDLGVLVQQACTAVSRLAQGRGIEIDMCPPSEIVMVSTDASMAHQVIVSLMSYAIQQALPGVIYLDLQPEASGGVLTLRFIAQGLNPDTTAALNKLAERIRWKLTFLLEPPDRAQIILYTTPDKARLLVVDDNQDWIELMARFLEGYDCTIVSSTENQDIVQQAQHSPPSAIILDVMMPKRDGWEILQRLRVQPATASIPIIVCSVFNDPQLAYSLGATSFVAKPASRETILSALQQIGIIS